MSPSNKEGLSWKTQPFFVRDYYLLVQRAQVTFG